MTTVDSDNADASSMKILFVNRMAGIVRGGGETFDLEISRHLAELGCDITILTGGALLSAAPLGFKEWYGADAGSNVKRMKRCVLRSPYLPWFPWDKIKGGWRVRVWEFRQFEKKAAKWIAAHGDAYHIIQICELPYLVSLLKSKIQNPKSKIVMRLTAPNAYDPMGGTQLADAVIASGMTIAEMKKGARPDCHDVPNGVDVNNFQAVPSAFRAQNGITDTTTMLLYVARFQDFKNHRVLIDAFNLFCREYPDSILVLAGSGHLEGSIREQVFRCKLDEKVMFLGEVNYSELPSIYAAADIKVISSDYESFCFAAIEAMASGLPVVTTDCGWVPTLVGKDIQHTTLSAPHSEIEKVPGGLVAPIKNAAALAASLNWVMQHPDESKAMGEWNRNRAVEKHSWGNSAEKLLRIYTKILEDR